MKTFTIKTALLIIVGCLFFIAPLKAIDEGGDSSNPYVDIPDAQFKAWLMEKYPSCFTSGGEFPPPNFVPLLDTTCTSIVNATILDISYKNITSLEGIQYFKSLEYIYAQGNVITQVKDRFPVTVKQIDLSNNRITVLERVPPSIIKLDISKNFLSELPPLPASLQVLNVSDNKFTSLGSLPTTLTTLNASYNFIADDDNNPSTIPSNLPSNTDITNNFPLDFSYQTSCGDRSVKFAAVTPQKTNYTYQWNFGDVTNNSSTLDRPEHLFSQFKAYDVKLTLTVIIHRTAVESIGETQTFVEYDAVKTIDVTKKVSVESGFTVSLKDVKLCTANTVLDAGEGYTSYLWQDGSTSQTFTATQPGIYSVTVTNASGCTASAQMAVVMCDDLKDLLQTIKIPNVFTPNGDGRNEFFEIKNLSQFLGNKLTIYDRWGGLVYEAVNYNSNWNATGVDPSVYFYQLTVYGMNQPAKTVTGWVEVLGERK